jgi:hypothetical protein
MALHRGIDGSQPIPSGPAGRLGRVASDPRVATVGRLGTGTLACPDCDAPVAIAGPWRPHDALSCSFCGHGGALREFLSLAQPTRPARVEIRVVSGPA